MPFAYNPLTLSYSTEHVTTLLHHHRQFGPSAARQPGGGNPWTAGYGQQGLSHSDPTSNRQPVDSFAKLTEVLRKPPLPWNSQFFCWEDQERNFSVPKTWREMSSRVDANVTSFIGNYFRILLIIFFSVL